MASVVNFRACSWQLSAPSPATSAPQDSHGLPAGPGVPAGCRGCRESSNAVTKESLLLQSGLPVASGLRGSTTTFPAAAGSALRLCCPESSDASGGVEMPGDPAKTRPGHRADSRLAGATGNFSKHR